MNARKCPDCGSRTTQREATFHEGTIIEVVRTCSDCATQFTVSYEAVQKETDGQ